MENTKKYNAIFESIFSTAEESVEQMVYRKTEGWNSIGHMMLLGEIEETFNIALSSHDMMEIWSYQKGKEILKKYGIEV